MRRFLPVAAPVVVIAALGACAARVPIGASGHRTASTSPAVVAVTSATRPAADAVALAYGSYSACLEDLQGCDTALLGVARAGEVLDRDRALVETWRGEGYSAIGRDEFRFVITSARPDFGSGKVFVTACFSDPTMLVAPGEASDGSDLVVRSGVVSGTETWVVAPSANGTWQAIGRTPDGPTANVDVCGAAS